MKKAAIIKDNPTWELPDFKELSYFKKKNDYALCVFVINEGERIRAQIDRMDRYADQVDVVIADGGSTDGSLDDDFIKTHKVRAVILKKGPGKLSAQMRATFAWALTEGYKGVIVVDGNGKDDISAIPNFVKLLGEGYDHIQGSRFIPGGKAINTPLSRKIGLRLVHAPLISLAAGKRHTDTTNGFRGYSAKLLRDEAIAVFRDVFQTYELHYYLAIESSRRDYKTIETPVTRAYPNVGKTPTKISPIRGSLHILGVLFKVVTGRFAKR